MPRAKRKVLDKSKSSIKASASTKRNSRSTPRRQAESEAIMQHSAAPTAEANEPPLFFWKETEKEGGFLSPWYKSQFKNEGATYESVGHAIMAEKARIFGDKVLAPSPDIRSMRFLI